MRYSLAVQFEEALKLGGLESARSILEGLERTPDTGGLLLPECYADLAKAFDRRGQHDEAIAALERAMDHGWSGRPDPRSDIAEFHLRAGRGEEAARIWAELKLQDPDDVWLYNAAGPSYGEVGNHELAVEWLGEGIEVAFRSDDPEWIVAQLSDVRRASLKALGRELDDLEERVDPFLEHWRDRRRERRSWSEVSSPADEWLAAPETGEGSSAGRGGGVAVAMAWFPAAEYDKAIERWEDLAEHWADVPHPDYCRQLDAHIRWMGANGVRVRAVARIVVDDFVAWCNERGEEPEEARAHYAADQYRLGGAIDWPPGRNEPCWCGSGHKYKKCCGASPAAPMHAEARDQSA